MPRPTMKDMVPVTIATPAGTSPEGKSISVNMNMKKLTTCIVKYIMINPTTNEIVAAKPLTE